MAADLFKSDSFFQGLVQRASDHVHADLQRICLRGPEKLLVQTRHLQPLLVCVSLGYFRQLAVRGIHPQGVLGHSLGEITALAAAGVVTFEEAVDMAARRGEYMDEVAVKVDGGMVAVTTRQRDPLLQELTAASWRERLTVANDNAPEQMVISGQRVVLEEAVRFIQGARLGHCRVLPVAGPWHSPFMREAQRQFAIWLQATHFNAPQIGLLLNASASWETDPAHIRDLAIRNLSEPVQWRASMDCLKAKQPVQLFEVGPGRILSGLARINGFDEATCIVNVNNLRGVELAAASVEEKTA